MEILTQKHPLWDSKTRNSAGNVHFDFLTKSTSLSLLTLQDLPTRFHPVMSRTSTLDLFIGSNKYISNCKVTSSSNISGTSDHYPKFLEIENSLNGIPLVFEGSGKQKIISGQHGRIQQNNLSFLLLNVPMTL